MEEKTEDEDINRKKDTILIIAGIIIIIVISLIFILPRYIPKDNSLSLDDLHEKNLDGRLSDDRGYIYKGLYSFVLYDGLWYTQLKNPAGTKLFNIPFHYSPRDVEQITPLGILNYSNLNAYDYFYVTFDPLDEQFSYIAASTHEADSVFISVFGKAVIASCIRNETTACYDRPIIDCNSTSAPVIYFASEDKTQVVYLNNCIIVAGRGTELFRSTDRMLFDLLDVI